MRSSLLLAVCFIALAHTSFAQATSIQATIAYAQISPINTTGQRKSLADNTLYEMKSNYPALYSQYMTGKRHTTTGWILFGTGGACLIVGYYMVINEIYMLNAIIGAPAMLSGAVCVATSVPYLIIGSATKNFAVKKFNEQYYSSKASPYFRLNVYPNRMGVAYVF